MDHNYSEINPVPTIAAFEAKREAELGQSSPTSSELSEKELPPAPEHGESDRSSLESKDDRTKMKEQMTAPNQAPTEKLKKRKGGPHTVKDPVTGLDVIVKDAKFKDYPKTEELDPGISNGTATQLPSTSFRKRHTKSASTTSNPTSPKQTSPNPSKPGNVSLFPYLPPAPPELNKLSSMLDRLQIALAVAFAVIWFFFGFPHSGRWYVPFTKPFWSLVMRSTFISTIAFGLISTVSIVQRSIVKEFPRLASSMHQVRGETFSPPTPESVEWLNAFIRTFWGLVNPDMFIPIADMVEDVMQQSLPKFVDAVRLSDIGQGSNPLRIVSMRALPDRPEDKDYPKEEWIDQGTGDLTKRKEIHDQAGVKEVDTDQSGDYVNFEVALSYQALPGQGHDLRAKNIHLLIEFFLGLYDWLHIPIPIWIQVEGFVATARLRVQFIQQYPYVRNVTFTLMGVPAVEVSAIPMTTGLGPFKMPNVLDLPLISGFVKSAIQAGTAEFVAPKSMTLNMMEMLSGNAIDDTRAQGVFIVTIHHAEGLSAQDKNGSSDPYIVLAYAKFGKPLYSTRIILADLNPCFEETTALLVGKDDIKAGEDLAVMLWDSDRRTADDLIGRVQISIKELMKEPNTIKTRTDKLTGFEDADTMSGTLHWSIGYFEKVPLRKDLELPEENPPPPPKKTAPEMEMRPGDKAPNPGARDLPPPPPEVRRTPPDPDYPSGILSVVIHQINNLERQNLRGTSGKDREGQAGQDTDDPSEQSSNLPSSYCEIIINDDLVYKTRVKQYTTMPYFEAGTEKFVRDWKNTVVRIVVRDSRLREKDPILGVVNLKLGDMLTTGSEVSRLMPITEGIGFGRLNVSLLFRGVKIETPRKGLGWDTGTVEILAPITLRLNGSSSSLSSAQGMNVVLSTTDSTERISASSSSVNGSDVTWKIGASDDPSDLAPLRLPVYNRYASSLTFEIGSGSRLGKSKMQALGILWLKDLVDDEEADVEVEVVVGKDLKQLRQNVLTDFTKRTHEYEVIGVIKTTVRIDKGLDEDHESHAKSQARRHAFEAYDHVEGEALVAERNAHANDDGVIDAKEKKAIERAQKRQLANRQRGIYGYRPYRTGLWIKEGLKSRLTMKKKDQGGKRDPAVQSEAQA